MNGETPRTGNKEQEDGTPPGAEAEGGEASAVLRLIPCPACGLPGEITELFTLSSTDGPVDHIAVVCIADHFFRMAVDRLPAETRVVVRPGHAAHR